MTMVRTRKSRANGDTKAWEKETEGDIFGEYLRIIILQQVILSLFNPMFLA